VTTKGGVMSALGFGCWASDCVSDSHDDCYAASMACKSMSRPCRARRDLNEHPLELVRAHALQEAEEAAKKVLFIGPIFDAAAEGRHRAPAGAVIPLHFQCTK
jgi:hypothetical protein